MKCPKCGTEIARFDLAPNCKKCGVHIMYYTQEEDLRRDAKKTELEAASARLLVAKLKAAFIGNRLSVLKMVLILLSVASLLLPLYNINIAFPSWEYEISVGALGVYGMISDSFWQLFGALSDIGLSNAIVTLVLVSFVLLLLSAVFIVILLALWILSFINTKKTSRISVLFSVAGMISQLAGTIVSFVAINLAGAYEHMTARPLFGGLVSIVILGALFAVNLVLGINPPETVLKDADRQRLEISARLKKGEITLDELSLPIIEEEKNEETSENKKKKRGQKR